MEKKAKRYCIEKLIAYDLKTKTETWKRTKWCNDRDDLLGMFLGEDCRIFDYQDNKELRRNVNLKSWEI